jgi:hypothetical protein
VATGWPGRRRMTTAAAAAAGHRLHADRMPSKVPALVVRAPARTHRAPGPEACALLHTSNPYLAESLLCF